MSFSLAIKENLVPFLNGIKSLCKPEEIVPVASEAVANRLRAHFDELQNTHPNKQEWPRQNFWEKVSRSVKSTARTTGAVTIAIDHPGVALRYFGGEVKPVSAKYLTIPATADAYGKRAREFGNLRFGFAVNEYGRFQPALVERTRTVLSRTDRSGVARKSENTKTGSSSSQVKLWLAKETQHTADPEVLPTDEELSQAAVEQVEKFIQQKIAEMGGNK